MNAVGVLLFAAAVLTVGARHKKEWELVDVKKASREVLSPLHHYDKSACINGAGFYRDPTDCHQYIRCVDDYSTGRRFSVFFGRCRPGLVFDENITSCNWPELAAPCSNSPERLKDTSKFNPIEQNQQPFSQDNVIPEHFVDNRNKPYTQQQDVQKPQDSFNQFVQEANIIQESENEVQNTFQEKNNEDHFQQPHKDSQNTHIEQNERWQQAETQQEPIPQIQQSQEPITQEKTEQVFQNDNSQQQAIEQEPETQPVVAEQTKDNEQEIHQQKIDDQLKDNQFQEQVQTGFQEIKDSESDRINLSPSEQQQEAQSQWWIPGSNEHRPSNPSINDQHPVSTTLNEPILCSSEGFYRHPSNCSRFVRCVKTEQGAYSVHFFECANHLFFDEKSSACIIAESDKCTTRTKRQAPDSTPLECSGEGFFRHPVDCRSFYRCVRTATGNYETHLFSCPETLVFDEEYATCNWPDKAPPCETRRRFSKPTRPSPPSRQQYKPIKTTTRPKSDVFDFKPVRGVSRDKYTQSPKYTTQAPSRGGQMCSSPGFYRHDNDCTKFYKCVRKGNYFVRYELSCPSNFAYDEATSRCVSQRNLKTCNRRNTNFPQRQNDEEVTSTTTEAPADESRPEESDDDIQCEKEGFFRNPNDCNRFYRCVDVGGDGKEFIRYDFKCPDDLVFDEATSVCNWPDQTAPCDGSSGGKGGKDSNGDGGEPNPPEEEEDSGVSSSATTDRTTTIRSTTSRATSESEESTTKAVSESPSGPNEGTQGPGDSESGCSQEGFFRNPEDCNKFYRCVDFGGDGKEFIRYDFDCPDGLVFDETNSVCNWPEDSPPCDSSPGEDGKNQGESSTQRDEDSTTKRQSTTTPATTPSEISTSENTTPSAARTSSVTEGSTTSSENGDGSTSSEGERGTSNTGECKEAGFFRNPEDCNKFYRCVDYNEDGQEFVKYDFSCPDGLVFDETNSVCNWPDQSAPCEEGDSEKEGGNTDSDTSTEKSTSTTPVSTSSAERTEGSTSTDSRPTSRQTTSPPSRRPTRRPTESTTGSTTTGTSEDSTTSKDTSTRGESGNTVECKEAGFFRNPDDCNKFYRCVDYNGDGQEFVKYDFSCPDGLVFDEANSVCNWPDQSAPCEGDSGKKGGSTDSEESTTSTTQRPVSTSSTESTGSTSTDSTPTSRQTASPPSRRPTRRPTESTTGSTPTSRQTTSPPSRRPTRRPTESTTGSTTTGTSEDSTTSKDTTTRGESGNTGECKEAGFFRNPDDCNKFYRCVDFKGDGQEFVKYDFSCPEGLVFDEVNSVCNWPEQSPPCERGTGSTDEGTKGIEGSTTSQTDASKEETSSQASTTESQTSTTESQTSTTPAIPTTASTTTDSTPSDSDECTEPGFFRCRDDCRKFYRCVDENEYGQRLKRYDFQCPDGLLFDDKNKRCDFPSDELTCDTDSTSTTGATSQSTTPSTTSPQTTQRTTTVIPATSTSGTSSSESGDECSEEGFFRDPNDCTKYYRCIDEGDGRFTREDFSCAEDEVFDEEMRYCNRKDLAPPCEEGSTDKTRGTTESSSTSGEDTTDGSKAECTESGFFRCPEDCTKFYRCVDESGDGETYVRHNFTCPEGLIFDEKNKKCDWPSSELTCDDESSTSGTSSGTSTTPSDISSTETSSSTSSGTTSGSADECTEEGFFRNPDDCSKYYRCLDEGDGTFSREDFSCAEDEVFDDEMRYCNRKDLAPPCEESSSDKTTSSTTSSGTSSTGTSSSSTSGTSSDCTEEGFFRDPDDCSKYYRCLDEGDGTFTREDFSCAEDEVFDEEMRYCNRKDLAPPCDENSSSTTASSTSNTEGSSSVTGDSESSSVTEDNGITSSTATTSGTESTTTSGTESSNSGECQEEGFHRHPDDCNKFYRCVDFEGDGSSFTKYDFECPEGLVFDETNSVCNWPSSVPSCESSGGTSTGDSGTSITQSVSDSTSSDTASTSGSTDTTSGSTATTGSSESTTSTSSDTENTDSSSTTGSTSSSDGTTSGEKSSGDMECTEEGFFRHPDDCTKFYRCVDFAGTGESYVRYDFECPRDLVFDEVNSVCNWPNMSPPCDSGSRNEDNETSSTTSGSNDSESTTDSETSQASTTPSSTSTTSSSTTLQSTGETTSDTTEEGEFRCEEEGFFRDPKSCKKYYECKRDEDSGELVKIDCECPDGHIFDEEGWYCNVEELSKPCDDGSFKCQEEGFFRDPEDCTKYFQCNKTEQGGFTKKQFECTNGNVFDEEGRYCNAPELSQPCDDSSNSTESTTASESSSSSSTGTPSESTSSSSTGTSSESSTSSSTGTSDQSGQCTEEGFFRNPEDCSQYYQCTRNEDSGEFDRRDFTCPDGRIFDEGISYCNDPELSDEPCESSDNGTSTPQEQTDSDDSSTTSGTTSTTEATSSGGDSSSTTNPNTQSRRGGGDPECKEAGFFRHPKDCNKFYRCVDFSGSGQSFVRFDFDCPEGLHFDEVNSVCNWPTMTPGCTSETEKNFIS